MARITLSLEVPEKDALIKLAIRELRDPRAQAALIIRQDLERRGLLTPPASQELAKAARFGAQDDRPG
jgi:hypothetical protein